MGNIARVKFPFSSSVAEIPVLVMIILVLILLQLYLHFLSSQLRNVWVVDDDQKKLSRNVSLPKKIDNEKKLCIEEVKDAMEKLAEKNLCDEELFEEEVSLEEVREAFDVFDENKDGFIDAGEVQRVLCALGSVETSEKDCKSMIKAFDRDGDEKIDFKEFVKIMEDSFR
ncbi:putative calcium-binding protein CML45 [Morus notabilis]|uniref:Putative calcium-binding protein CML45 n=1 Tax=Morus notabilis TaxID=981085 RepID=W9QJD1_9ROSA|nr:probable calcium-binding protein CML45 [Morus notabilis]EXB38568.1 putative calcium-binding protein CML45 [Morus notabilis]